MLKNVNQKNRYLGVLMVLALVIFSSVVLAGLWHLATDRAYASGPGSNVKSSKSASQSCGAWNTVPSWSQGMDSPLKGITALDPNNAWAVGSYRMGSGITYAQIQRYNGNQWGIFASPIITDSGLNGVDASSATDVWAVGYQWVQLDPHNRAMMPLVEHWNGNRWSVVSAPGTSSFGEAVLLDVEAIAPNDVWVVGYWASQPFYPNRPLSMHWDGSSWTIVPTPEEPDSASRLYSISAASPSDIWAVGSTGHDSATLAMHWNGSEWRVVPSNNPGITNALYGVAALSVNNVWAVGSQTSTMDPRSPLIIHWDGISWTQLPVPERTYGALLAISAASAEDIWAVGGEDVYNENVYPPDTVVRALHWDGEHWERASISTPGTRLNAFRAVAAFGGTGTLAVGVAQFSDTSTSLAAKFTDNCAPPTPVPTPTSTEPNCVPVEGWAELIARSAPTSSSYVNGLGGLSGDTILAVGENRQGAAWASDYQQVWDGLDWKYSPYFSEDVLSRAFRAATMASPNTGYAVGFTSSEPWHDRPVIARYSNGEWRNVATSRREGAERHYLSGISALAETNVWAVGHYEESGTLTRKTLTMHWDGNQWSIVPSPNPGAAGNVLTAVKALSADDVWAVGYRSNANNSGSDSPLLLHWDGLQWQEVEAPTELAGLGSSRLTSVDASLPYYVLAAGYRVSPGGQTSTLIIKWDGTQWTSLPTPNPGTAGNVLRGISVYGDATAWAVGSFNSSGISQTLVLQWGGNSWNQVEGPIGSSEGSELSSVLAVGWNEVFVGGYKRLGNRDVPLLARFRRICSNMVGTPVPAGEFADVRPGEYFYSAVKTLNKAGVVSGYNSSPPCESAAGVPCFKPYGNITRGQVAKVLILATGMQSEPAEQAFEDVPSTGPFYSYIEQLASAGIISGYPCGQPGEPCVAPASRPYFRPNAPVTRGQFSKMAAQVFGYDDQVSGQTFQDVPENSTFYQYVERIAARGIISGYACGGAGESCVGPQNRPYFRPGNNITRGQAAKIIHLALQGSNTDSKP